MAPSEAPRHVRAAFLALAGLVGIVFMLTGRHSDSIEDAVPQARPLRLGGGAVERARVEAKATMEKEWRSAEAAAARRVTGRRPAFSCNVTKSLGNATGSAATCRACARLYDARPGLGPNVDGSCVYVPAQGGCVANAIATYKALMPQEDCAIPVRQECTDWMCYLNRYPDLKEAADGEAAANRSRGGTEAQAHAARLEFSRWHYTGFGKPEGRDCSCPVCNCGSYMSLGGMDMCLGAERCDGCKWWHKVPHHPVQAQQDHVTADIVVAHCMFDKLSWLEEAMLHVKARMVLRRVTVISKCGHAPPQDQVPPGVELRYLPNHGRNDQAWATYIHWKYDDLSDVTFFLKDTTFEYPIPELKLLVKSMPMMVDEVLTHSFSCSRKPHLNASIWHSRQELWKFGLGSYHPPRGKEHTGGYTTAKLDMVHYLQHMTEPEELERLHRQALLPVCYGGSFVGSRAFMKKWSKESWRKIMHSMTHADNVEEGHYFERLWMSMLSPLLEPDVEEQLVRHAGHTVATLQDIFGRSYLGALRSCCCASNTLPSKLAVSRMLPQESRTWAIPGRPKTGSEMSARWREVTTAFTTRQLATMKRKLHVLLVTHSLDMDGAPFYLLHLGKFLHASGISVAVASPTDGALRALYEPMGIQVSVLPELERLSLVEAVGLPTWNAMFQRRLLDTFGALPEIIFWNTVVWAPVIARHEKVCPRTPRAVWILHEFEITQETHQNGFWFGEMFSELNDDNIRRTIHAADAIVFVSDIQRSLWAHYNVTRFYTLRGFAATEVPSYVSNTSLRAASRRAYGISESSFVLSGVGTFCERKRQLWMVEALRYLLQEGKDAWLLMIGAPSKAGGAGDLGYAGEVMNLVAGKKDLRKRALMIPRSKHVAYYLWLADLHLSTSTHEAYPLNTLEAMLLGVPVVATPAGGTEEQFMDPRTEWMCSHNLTDFNEFMSKVRRAYDLHTQGQLAQYGKLLRDTVAQPARGVFQQELLHIIQDLSAYWTNENSDLAMSFC